MNSQQVIQQTKDVLKTNYDLFDPINVTEIYNRPEPSEVEEGGIKYLTFFYPRQIPPDNVDGFRLKGNKGFISISETYKVISRTPEDLELVGYVYRYITDEMSYHCYFKPSNRNKENIPYNFHFDWDFKFKPVDDHQTRLHPDKHLQVLHPHPRFKTEEINLLDFIALIRVSCLDDGGNPIIEPFFDFSL